MNTCSNCGEEIQYPYPNQICLGQAGMPMNCSCPGYHSFLATGEFYASYTYTSWNCVSCGLDQAISKFNKSPAVELYSGQILDVESSPGGIPTAKTYCKDRLIAQKRIEHANQNKQEELL